MGWCAGTSDAVGRAIVPEAGRARAARFIAVGRGVGRRALVLVGGFRAVVARSSSTDRRRGVAAKTGVSPAATGVRPRRARQTFPAQTGAAVAGDPCATVPSVALVTSRVGALPALAAPVPL